MKWGVRKANPTSADIHSARQRQEQRMQEGITYNRVASTATGKARTAAEARAKKHIVDWQTNEDSVGSAVITNTKENHGKPNC